MMTTLRYVMKTMAAAKCKAEFLAVLKDVERKREPVLVTRNGKPAAKVVPLELAEGKDPLDAFYYGKIEIVGDITAPLYTDEEYEEFFERSVDQLR